jgi:hypothetical protein
MKSAIPRSGDAAAPAQVFCRARHIGAVSASVLFVAVLLGGLAAPASAQRQVALGGSVACSSCSASRRFLTLRATQV